ncbi:hypothetical protein HDU79_000695 [Rhizoclosmatium sp. JEL0117]|nr:hypothetical protein HDU79_000695 [Rhizoclosmatium sp. JEL0117]
MDSYLGLLHGYNDAVELLLKHPKVEPKDLALCAAVKENHLSTVQILLSNPQITSNPKTINNGIKAAAESNRVDMMRLLLAVPCSDPSHNNSYPLHYSSNCKNLEMIKLLLEDGRADPMALDGIALIYVLRSKKTKEIVQALLKDPRMDPSIMDNLCIRKALEFGWTDIVKTLLEDERVDPSVSLNLPLRCAIKSGNLELVKCIWGHPRTVVPAMKIPHWIVSAKARKFYDIVEFLSGKL